MNILDWFAVGMKRVVTDPLDWDMTNAVDLGAGNTPTPGATALDLPGWDAEFDQIPYLAGTVTCIIAHHFFEHLTGPKAIRMLRECERVLAPGGTLNVVTPYYTSQMQAHDLTHRSAWCEETWKVLFHTPYYDHNREVPWRLQVHCCYILGIVERNVALFTQLVKL